MDGKPLSQFKLARLQAQQEKEAAACNARQTQTPSAATPAGVPDPKEAAPKEAAAAPAATRESSHKVPVQPLAAQKRQFPHSTISTEAGHGAHQQPTGGHRRQSDETVEDKVERYSEFVDETLRVKLEQVLEQREEVVRESAAYEKLRGTVQVMRESQSSKAKSMVNIGCEVYMQAAIPDTSRIMVNVGLGFFVELTLAEAADFIQQRCEQLQARADQLSEAASEIRSQIEVVLRGLQELMQISDPTPANQRSAFL